MHPSLTAEGYISLGDWRWTSSEDSLVLLDDDSNLPYIDAEGNPAVVQYNAEGVSVGDSPQSQYGVSLKYSYEHLHRHATRCSAATWLTPSTNGENEGRQSWQIPTYGLLDLHAGYNFTMNETNMDVRLSAFNILNTVYRRATPKTTMRTASGTSPIPTANTPSVKTTSMPDRPVCTWAAATAPTQHPHPILA